MLHQLTFHFQRHVNRNGKRNAHETARARINLRVDANHFTGEVEQRPARIARVDGDIGLDEGDVGFGGQAARLGGDNPCRHGVFKAKGRTDGDHPLPDAHLVRVAHAHHGQILAVDFQHGDVGTLIDADDFGLHLALVVECHRHFRIRARRGAHYVRIGQHIAIGADDEARTNALRNLRRTAARETRMAGHRETKAAHQVIERVIRRHARKARHRRASGEFFHDADIDHRSAHFLHQSRKIRQRTRNQRRRIIFRLGTRNHRRHTQHHTGHSQTQQIFFHCIALRKVREKPQTAHRRSARHYPHKKRATPRLRACQFVTEFVHTPAQPMPTDTSSVSIACFFTRIFAMRPLLLVLCCAAALSVCGCGIKGPLYLPKEPAQTAKKPAQTAKKPAQTAEEPAQSAEEPAQTAPEQTATP